MKFYFRQYLVLIFTLSSIVILAQEPQTIKVRRESNLAKAFFDVTEFKLTPIDRFGNPQENRIMGFKLFVKTKRDTKQFNSTSGNLTSEMIQFLNSLNTACKIFFTEIMVEEDEQRLIKLPDVIDVWFPNPYKKSKK